MKLQSFFIAVNILSTIFLVDVVAAQTISCPPNSGNCGAPTAHTASINCSQCNSGSFILSCTCCQYRSGSPCAETNLCGATNGACNTTQCAICTNTTGNDTQVSCRRCGTQSCSDSRCNVAGRAAFVAPSNTISVIETNDAIPSVAVSVVSDLQSPLRLTGVKIKDSIDGLSITGVELNGIEAPVLMVQIEFLLRSPSGFVSSTSHLLDRSEHPSVLSKDYSFCALTAKSLLPGLVQVQAQLGYVLFADGTKGGISANEIHPKAVAYLTPKLNAYRELSGFLQAHHDADIKKFLKDKPQLASFVTLFEKSGREGVQNEVSRLIDVFQKAGI